jgi:hypothetical protein
VIKEVQLGLNREDPTKSRERTAWFGAASFEERSIGSLREIAANGMPLESVTLVFYETSVTPEGSSATQRLANMSTLAKLTDMITGAAPKGAPMPPYSYGAGRRFALEALNAGYVRVVFDISCLTKIHTLALAAAIAEFQGNTEVWISYTVPENYPGISAPPRPTDGWRDIIVAPLSDAARFFNEGSGRGIVLIGHETDRLILGLAEIEPAGGTIVAAFSAERPDLGEVSLRRNQRMVRQLLSMRSSDWRRIDIGLRDWNRLGEVVADEVRNASQAGAPVIVYPYGPKPHVFATAYELARTYYENAWFVYPIPTSYDAAYSEGIGAVTWSRVKKRVLDASGA